MATDVQRLAQIEQRQVETNTLLVEILGALETMVDNQTNMADRFVELKAWLEEPPKSDLPDAFKRLTAAVEAQTQFLVALPAAVARAVNDGELPGRG
jgi:hypothetical protein